MVRCKRCVMPDTRPGAIFVGGVCQACRNYDTNQAVNWVGRKDELSRLCNFYRSGNSSRPHLYDCVIPVSGGKDSHFAVYTLRSMGMNPLLVSVVDLFSHTKAGEHNFRNLGVEFDCDLITITPSLSLQHSVTRQAFEESCEPLKFLETAIYLSPVRLAKDKNIPWVVFGENASFLYGAASKDFFDASSVIGTGDSALADKGRKKGWDYWQSMGVKEAELNVINLDNRPNFIVMPMFLSYFVPWDDEANLQVAKSHGFQTLGQEWVREGWIEDYTQIDSFGYLVHIWLKYPKFGFARASDIASRWVRKGLISRDEAMAIVMAKDHLLDGKALEDFCTILGYSETQFWDIVDRFWNREIFERVNGKWRIKE